MWSCVENFTTSLYVFQLKRCFSCHSLLQESQNVRRVEVESKCKRRVKQTLPAVIMEVESWRKKWSTKENRQYLCFVSGVIHFLCRMRFCRYKKWISNVHCSWNELSQYFVRDTALVYVVGQ